MKNNDLLRHEETILRILQVKGEQILVIDCTRRSMPKWTVQHELALYVSCTEEELLSATGTVLCSQESLDAVGRKIARERFTLIAGILPFIGDEKQRCYMIAQISSLKSISKQTIRKYLYRYLVYQDLAALAPVQKQETRPLTQDEKTMRWALNKFYFTGQKHSLATAYTLMLKAKYCDDTGVLFSKYPSIHQFRYFYRKHKKLQTCYISRNGLTHYQRNNRPLLGDGVQAFAPAVGVGMLDATVCDIYLVNDAGEVVGRPILTACVDAYSRLCCGYALSWEGGVYSLRTLMANVITDKTEWCKRFGISIQGVDWNCRQLPATLVTDMGNEYQSEQFSQIAELGVTLVHLPPYRPELKGVVEKFFDVIQNSFKKHLKGKGVIEPDFQERGGHDYRKDACLTMAEFETVVLHSVLYYNTKRVIESFPYTEEMLEEAVPPFASSLWNWGISQPGANLIPVDYNTLMLTLLPRTTGRFSREGLVVNKLRYKREGYTEQYLRGETVIAAYNPDDVSCVWLMEQGEFVRFELIESRFRDKTLACVVSMKSDQKTLIRAAQEKSIQAQIDLAAHIEAIASSSRSMTNNLQSIRKTRSVERNRTHVDFIRRENAE